MMEFWIQLWTWILVFNVLGFGFLAVAVTIGGFGNILSMLKSLREQHAEQDSQ